MRQLQKVLWSKGTLLNPQHLQLQDRYLEELVEFRLNALTFCPWGFRRLSIDAQALAGGTLVVTDAAGLLPDGLVFDVPHADAAPAPLPLGDHWRPDQAELLVHLAIPEHRYGGHNVSSRNGTADTRYIADVMLIRDENTGLAEKPIQVARRNLRLLAEGESLEGTVSMPLARVRRDAAGALELDPTYIPPVVALEASAVLLTMARRLVELLAAKSSALSAMRRQRSGWLADFGISDVEHFWLLYTVNTSLPHFRHLYDARGSHPARLFTAMLELAGTLMTFGDARIGDLPEYSHADLTTCFTRLDLLTRQLLDTAVPQHHVSLPLHRTRPTVYETALTEERFLTAPQVYIAIAAAGQEDLVRQVPQRLKIGAADTIERLIRSAVGGVPLAHVPSPPRSIPIKLNYHYFALQRKGEDWDAIRMSRTLAVYAPKELGEPEMEVVILLPEK